MTTGITCWRYSVPNVQGEGWAIAHLDSRGFFSVVGDFGEYGYLWRNFGDLDFRAFLCKLGPDYLMGKLGQQTEVDRQETAHALRREICQDRRAGLLDREQAAEDWAAVESFADDSSYSAEWLIDQLHLEDVGEYFVMDYPSRLKGFVEGVWPRLVAAMQEDLERDTLSASSITDRLRRLSSPERDALRAAVSALYFADFADYRSAVWSVVRALLQLDAAQIEAFDGAAWARALNPEWEGFNSFLKLTYGYPSLYNYGMHRKLVGIREAAEFLGVTPSTVRRWEHEGTLVPDEQTPGGYRRYDLARIRPGTVSSHAALRKTIAYARVSSHDQKDDLERQKQVLALYCARQGWTFEVVADLGSGMNSHKKGLKRLLNDILADRIGRLVITHKDRLLRLGAELVFAICEAKQIEVVILNPGEDTTFEEELAQDVLEIITVFSARLYGSRSRRNQKLLDGVKHAVEEASS